MTTSIVRSIDIHSEAVRSGHDGIFPRVRDNGGFLLRVGTGEEWTVIVAAVAVVVDPDGAVEPATGLDVQTFVVVAVVGEVSVSAGGIGQFVKGGGDGGAGFGASGVEAWDGWDGQ